MTTFLDGPAKGKTLMLKRSPKFLRVTESSGNFDALDQPSDTPRPEEILYAYELAEFKGNCHIRSAKKGASGFFTIADYRFVTDQPTDATMREQWVNWCEGRPA